VRPLLSETWMQALSLLLGLSFIIYVLYRLIWHKTQLRMLYIVALVI
jgi:thiol:disulfide interchange protein DsbD